MSNTARDTLAPLSETANQRAADAGIAIARLLDAVTAMTAAIKALPDDAPVVVVTPPVEPPVVEDPPAAGLYAEIGGIPAGITEFTGTDLSAATTAAIVKGTGYVASGPIRVSIFAATPGIVVTGKKGQQIQLAKGVKLAGLTFTGFGLAKDTDGTHAGIVTDDGCQLHSVEVTKSVGVGILFKGAGLKSYDLHSHHNGTSGRMVRSRGDNVTKGSGFHEVRSHLHHNNIGGRKSDAANKGTETSDYLGVNCRYHDEADGAQWWDIACWNIVMENPDIRNITTSAEWYRGVGVRFELNAWGTYPSGIYGGYIGDVAGAAVAVNESSNIEIKPDTIGPCAKSLEVRQQTRADDPGDGGTDPAKWLKDAKKRKGPGRPGGARLGWEVFNIVFTPKAVLPGAGPVGLSDSNGTLSPKTKDLSRSKNEIQIGGASVPIEIPA